MIKRSFFILALAFFALTSCKQSEPPEIIPTGDFGRFGDSLLFADRFWEIKHNENRVGPGPNYFSRRDEDVFLDDNGFLHMRIAEHDGKWYSTEIISTENMGYGTYIFTIEGDMRNVPNNTVLGLFTWDNNTFQTQANSEVDIEFSKWGNNGRDQTLLYSVQPLNFFGPTPERTIGPSINPFQNIGITTHAFTWTDSLISWSSYIGDVYEQGTPYATFEYDLSHPARAKLEGGRTSDAIKIPAPGLTTNARINYWIGTWIDNKPSDGQAQEVVIRNFEYRRL